MFFFPLLTFFCSCLFHEALLTLLFLLLQEQGMVGMPRQAGGVQPPHGVPGGVPSAGPNGAGPGSYLGSQQQQQQQQAAMMKQMMAMEQEKRVQLHLMEQQKVQLLREQRQQQQQHHLLAEQVRGIYTSHRRTHFLRSSSVSACTTKSRLCSEKIKALWTVMNMK